jgi:peptide/nickel transport system substrate-binding protein
MQPIGTGPWKFSKIVKDSTGHINSITFDRNDYYYSKLPYINTLRFRFFDDYGTALESLKSQNVEALSFIPNFGSIKFNNKSIVLYPLRFPEYTALFFNQTSQPVLKDYDLRLALAKAVDKIYLTQITLNNTAEVIDSPFLPGSSAYSENIKKIPFNLAEANSVLDKKWTRLQPEEYFELRRKQVLKELNPVASTSTASSSPELAVDENTISENIRAEMDPEQTFFRKDKDGNVLQLTITTSDSNEYGKTAEQIASEWRKIGVRVTIEKMNVARLLRESIRNRSYQVLLYSEITGSDPDPYPFWHSSQTDYPGLNLSGFSDRNADKLLEDSRLSSDPKTRTQNYIKFQDILTDELPAIFLYSPWHAMAINKEVKGVQISTLNLPSDRYSDLSNWYIKTKLKWK